MLALTFFLPFYEPVLLIYFTNNLGKTSTRNSEGKIKKKETKQQGFVCVYNQEQKSQ